VQILSQIALIPAEISAIVPHVLLVVEQSSLIASNIFDFIVDGLAIRCDLIGARAVFNIVSKRRSVLLQSLVIVMQIGALIVNILAISLKVLSIMSDISPVVMNVRRLSKRRRCDRPETGSKQRS